MSDHAGMDDSAIGTGVDKASEKLRELTLSAEPSSLSPDPPDFDFAARLLTAYGEMAASLEKIFADSSDQPKLVITVDETYMLSPVLTQGRYPYRPADIFCRVVNEYSHHRNHDSVWVSVFASITSKVASERSVIISHCSDFSAFSSFRQSRLCCHQGLETFPALHSTWLGPECVGAWTH
ncbi:hypothetical protein HD554DRAFT_1087649 [Boletus coccyginus]|nr:hypothetical protein HD554DRAFT_1087649 [Boletus coccyginus]